ncbi:hydrolase TatD [Clostridiaceae bacterium 14S0207]|nr:hydrolase TatD [Clostridiaceae bacterium 14S0207]
MIFDSHAHYDDESFNSDRYSLIEGLHNEKGIVGILNCGVSLETSKTSVQLAEKYDFIYAAIGVHPEEAEEFNEDIVNELKILAKNDKVKAIGEIGLDYYWDENPSKEVQKKVFIKQMELAKELNLPVVIHDRDAHGDTLEIIKMFPEVKGVVHCFSGSVEFARECLKADYYIGITGVVTFKNAKKIIDVVKEVPMDKLLVETDCPYMTPVPFRGKRNQSNYIEYVIEKIAEIKEMQKDEVANITIQNAKKFLKIW